MMENAFATNGSTDRDTTDLSVSLQRDGQNTPPTDSVECTLDDYSRSLWSLFSDGSQNFPGMGEDRSPSSLSSGGTRSRIPLLSRSASLREKRTRRSLDGDSPRIKRSDNKTPNVASTTPLPHSGALFRSASFATSRGLAGSFLSEHSKQSTASKSRHQHPLGSDGTTNRNSLPLYGSSYSSPYSRRNIARERKAQVALTEQNFKLTRGDLAKQDEEDNDSEKSFGSDRSAVSCDAGFSRMTMWGTTQKPHNILHCRHTQCNNADDYLTPTQRAARKIRELMRELKEARREITERDIKIASLTRELVELRIDKAEGASPESPSNAAPRRPSSFAKHIEFAKNSNSKQSPNDRKSSFLSASSSEPRADSSLCGTPPSDGSEIELRILKDLPPKGTPPMKEIAPLSSPGSFSLYEDSESCDLSRSLADSGHYEEVPSPCLSAKDSLDSGRSAVRRLVNTLCSEEESREASMVWSAIEAAENRVRSDYEKRFEELQRNQMNEYHELKEKHNDHVETLLSKLSEANLRYFEIRPLYEKAQGTIRVLEKDRDKLREDLKESEVRHQKVYLQMYLKGQEAARIEADGPNLSKKTSRETLQEGTSSEGHKDTVLGASASSEDDLASDSKVILGLMKQLSEGEEEIIKLKALYHHEMARSQRLSRSGFPRGRDEIDPEITLQFLKSAIYYFLTDKDNCQGHLRAIESILGYSSSERVTIGRHFNG